MASSIKNVILIGASGNIGSTIFHALTSSNKFNISILSRPESTHTYAANIKVITSDYTPASLTAAFQDQDAVVSVLGAAGFSEEIKIIDAAVAAGVKRFIPSEFGSNTNNTNVTSLVSAFETKRERNEYLKKQEDKGLSWTAIVTGMAFDFGAKAGLVGFNTTNHTAVLLDGGNRPFSTSNLSQIGNAVVAVLSDPSSTANKFIYVHSFTVTQREILAEFEKATGEKWTVTELTSEVAKTEGMRLLGEGDFSGLYLLLKIIALGDGYGADFREKGLSNELLGLPEQGLVESVKIVAKGDLV